MTRMHETIRYSAGGERASLSVAPVTAAVQIDPDRETGRGSLLPLRPARAYRASHHPVVATSRVNILHAAAVGIQTLTAKTAPAAPNREAGAWAKAHKPNSARPTRERESGLIAGQGISPKQGRDSRERPALFTNGASRRDRSRPEALLLTVGIYSGLTMDSTGRRVSCSRAEEWSPASLICRPRLNSQHVPHGGLRASRLPSDPDNTANAISGDFPAPRNRMVDSPPEVRHPGRKLGTLVRTATNRHRTRGSIPRQVHHHVLSSTAEQPSSPRDGRQGRSAVRPRQDVFSTECCWRGRCSVSADRVSGLTASHPRRESRPGKNMTARVQFWRARRTLWAPALRSGMGQTHHRSKNTAWIA